MRYLPHTPETRKEMLREIGIDSVDLLFQDIPASAKKIDLLPLPLHKSEIEVDRYFQQQAQKNLSAAQASYFLGGGAYHHHIPASVDALIQRGEYLTSYTPYQPEIAQGTLQYLYEFQTQVCLITGMEVANASLYDGATAAVEAVMMANRVTKRPKAIVYGNVHPHYQEVIRTYAHFSHGIVDCYAPSPNGTLQEPDIDDETSCVVVQYPDFFGHALDYSALAKKCHDAGVLFIVLVTEIVALGLLKSPGSMEADIVAGEGQSLGVGLNFGGPTVGLFATKERYLRQMPGRIVGQTIDADANRGWVLTLSTREQHIRREKATSNICTNAGLCALAFSIHLSLLGDVGFQRLAKLNHGAAVQLYNAIKTVPNIDILTSTFFNEFVIRLPIAAAPVVEKLIQHQILGGIPISRFYPGQFDNLLLVAATETNTPEEINHFVTILGEII